MESESSRDSERLPPQSFVPLIHEIAGPIRPAEWFASLSGSSGVLFLDSARLDPKLGRYSFLSADPFERVISRAGTIRQLRRGMPPRTVRFADPFAWLLERIRSWTTRTISGLPPFQGGAAGLFSYDLCHHIERLPRPRFDEFTVPDMMVGFYDWVIAIDHSDDRAWIISSGLPEQHGHARIARARQRIDAVRSWLEGAGMPPGARRSSRSSQPTPRVPLSTAYPVAGRPGILSSFSRAGYLEVVERCLEYLRAGDIFQVNIAQRLLAPVTIPPEQLYLRLRERNPAPFGGYLDAGRFTIASASPERFLQVVDGLAQTRPRSRGRDLAEPPPKTTCDCETTLRTAPRIGPRMS